MLTRLKTLEEASLVGISALTSEAALIDLRNTILGKNGSLTELLKGVKDLSDEEKKTVGKAINDTKIRITEAFETQLAKIKRDSISARLAGEFEDVTVPYPETVAIDSKTIGALHPITRTLREVIDSFKRMGFDLYESAEVTTEYLNFDAVNVPSTHPARDMQDTFWLEGSGNVLSTQTSSMQNLIMKNSKLPIKALIPGRVFRNEDVDATHENTFYQVEAIVVDKNISMANLQYTVKTMLSDIFEREVEIRLRPGYFPFVEPGVEVDFSCPFCGGEGCRICKKSGWIEFMGAGLIHPNVLRE